MNESVVNAQRSDDPDLPPLPSPARIQELLFDAARLGRLDMITGLLDLGASITATDARGYTPLILATYNDQIEAAQLLLARGAPIDQPDGDRGNTALMGVAFKGFLPIAEMLLASGADPHCVNRAGQSALMFASLFSRADIVDRLIALGADPEMQDAAGNSAISVALSQGNVGMATRLGHKR